MPIYLQPKRHNPSGPDGRGLNRLRIETGMQGDECALKPTSIMLFWEAQDTQRAGYGNYGPCDRGGKCKGCPMMDHTDLVRSMFFGDRIMIREDPSDPNIAHLMSKPKDGWDSYSKWMTWEKLLRGSNNLMVSFPVRDENGMFLWMEKV